MSRLFVSGGQIIGASALASVFLMNIQGLSRIFFSTTVHKHQFLGTQPSLYGLTLTSAYDYWKNRNFDLTDLCWQGNVFAF